MANPMKQSRKLAWVVLGVIAVCMVLVLASRPVLEVTCYREIINQPAADYQRSVAMMLIRGMLPDSVAEDAARVRVLQTRWGWLPLSEHIVYSYDDDDVLLKRHQQ